MQEIVYVADPMCSWCWAMSPRVGRIIEKSGLPARVVMGGLRIGSNAVVVDAESREKFRGYWQRVAEQSGQRYDPEVLQDGFRYDTHVPSTAVVAMRDLEPDLAITFLSRVHKAFYAERVDVTNVEATAALVADLGFDADGFASLMRSRHIEDLTLADYAWAQQIGATSFPTLLFSTDSWARAIAIGYTDEDSVLRNIESAHARAAEQGLA